MSDPVQQQVIDRIAFILFSDGHLTRIMSEALARKIVADLEAFNAHLEAKRAS
jgi:hypothetical protein